MMGMVPKLRGFLVLVGLLNYNIIER
jgi:hypothetical protein